MLTPADRSRSLTTVKFCRLTLTSGGKKKDADASKLADKTENETLETFLRLRAEAFASDDYFESDLAWMDLSSPVEVTIGPYETYEDKLFGYKSAFEAFVTVDVPAESAALSRYKEMLPFRRYLNQAVTV